MSNNLLIKKAKHRIKEKILCVELLNRKRYPSCVMIELTNRCNLKCTTCAREYEYGKDMKKGDMKLSSFQILIDEISPHCNFICLTGLGETLLYRQLSEALEYINEKNKNITTFISTNATLSNTPDIVRKIAGKVNIIQISVDGIGQTFNDITLNGNYNTFIDNVKQVVAITENTTTKLMFNMVAFEKNYSEMSDIILLARDLGISTMYINVMNLVSMPLRDIADYQFYSSVDFIKELEKAKRRAKELNISLSHFEFNSKKRCPFPRNCYYITWDGFLVPCCAKPFPHIMNFGNVFVESLKRCLNKRAFRRFRTQWQRNNFPDFCRGCSSIPGLPP